MSVAPWLRREADLWLNNGANLITLSRLPMLFCVNWALWGISTQGLAARLDPWLLSVGVLSIWLMLLVWNWYKPLWNAICTCATAAVLVCAQTKMTTQDGLGLFLFLVVMQVMGMVTDGLDGRFARKRSALRRGTSEGQFLDQFVDKIFVWTTWANLCVIMFLLSHGAWYTRSMLVVFTAASVYLFWLDARSCYKHFGNYLKDRGNDYNPDSGAKLPGKIKFVLENVVICAEILALTRLLDPVEGWRELVLFPFYFLGSFAFFLSPLTLGAAIYLARSSLRVRGVLKTKEQREEEELIKKHRIVLPAEAAAETDDE